MIIFKVKQEKYGDVKQDYGKLDFESLAILLDLKITRISYGYCDATYKGIEVSLTKHRTANKIKLSLKGYSYTFKDRSFNELTKKQCDNLIGSLELELQQTLSSLIKQTNKEEIYKKLTENLESLNISHYDKSVSILVNNQRFNFTLTLDNELICKDQMQVHYGYHYYSSSIDSVKKQFDNILQDFIDRKALMEQAKQVLMGHLPLIIQYFN
jgi:plasmid maintenance system killer protein